MPWSAAALLAATIMGARAAEPVPAVQMPAIVPIHLIGKITLPDGAPVAGASVSLIISNRDKDAEPKVVKGTSGPDGAFDVRTEGEPYQAYSAELFVTSP